MTIKEAADKYQVSKQAIYQRLKRNGLTVDSMTDKETGQLTPEAEGIMENLFGENRQLFDKRKFTPSDEIKALQEQVNSLQTNVELLTIKLEAAERERDLLKEQLEQTRQTLEQERLLFQRFLPAAGETKSGTEKRPGLFRRIATAIKGE
jgi:predicted DNA-binding protein YlxM (UPF0122 family)